MLILRKPTLIDLPPLYALAEDHRHKFLDDYTSFDLVFAQEVLINMPSAVIDDHGYACGVAWFDPVRDDLHAEIHLLINPQYWRRVIRQDVLRDLLNWGFEALGVNKIIARPMSTQKDAMRVLRRYSFYEHKPFYKHTRQKGVIVDEIVFELRRGYWNKINGKRQERKESQGPAGQGAGGTGSEELQRPVGKVRGRRVHTQSGPEPDPSPSHNEQQTE